MKALIIVDVQQDFLPGGALAILNGNEVVPVINNCQSAFQQVIATADWHPPNHVSFASTHNKQIGEQILVQGTPQLLWPDHCVQKTAGSEFASLLDLTRMNAVFYKGTNRGIDSYSAFFDHSKKQSTGLEAYLRSHRLKDIYFAGLATDYCVLYSVLDALDLGFNVFVLPDGCRGVNLQPSGEEQAFQLMKDRGASLIHSTKMLAQCQNK